MWKDRARFILRPGCHWTSMSGRVGVGGREWEGAVQLCCEHMCFSPTYPGVPHAVAMMPDSSVFDKPKSLIIILESSAGL